LKHISKFHSQLQRDETSYNSASPKPIYEQPITQGYAKPNMKRTSTILRRFQLEQKKLRN